MDKKALTIFILNAVDYFLAFIFLAVVGISMAINGGAYIDEYGIRLPAIYFIFAGVVFLVRTAVFIPQTIKFFKTGGATIPNLFQHIFGLVFDTLVCGVIFYISALVILSLLFPSPLLSFGWTWFAGITTYYLSKVGLLIFSVILRKKYKRRPECEDALR